jgi:hypothetical protein
MMMVLRIEKYREGGKQIHSRNFLDDMVDSVKTKSE